MAKSPSRENGKLLILKQIMFDLPLDCTLILLFHFYHVYFKFILGLLTLMTSDSEVVPVVKP